MNPTVPPTLMDSGDWIALASAIVSVVSLIFTIYFASKASRDAGRTASIAAGEAETSLRASISSTRAAVRQIGIQLAEVVKGRRKDQLNAEDTRLVKSYEGPFRESLEDNLNAYENACGKYIDNKIDKDRFKKDYVREIQNLCEAKAENPIHDFMNPEGSCKFKAIWKVYREWHHYEN